MLGFLFHKKRDEVKRVLHGRVNRAHARSIALQNIRGATRQIYSEVVWAIVCDAPDEADYSDVFPVVCRDLCTQGIGIFHNARIVAPCVIIGLRDESSPRFLACTVKHCTPLGYGFYHIGLFPEEVIDPTQEQVNALCGALAKYDSHEACCQRIAVEAGL